MFQEIANRAQRAVDTLVSKYVTRLAVAVPFVVALAFGTAAASVKLTEMYGSMRANAVLAGIFALLGLVTAAAIGFSQPTPELTAEPQRAVAHEPTAQQTGDAPLFANADAMLAAIGAIGPTALPMVLRLLVRNLPLVLGVLVLGYLLLSDTRKSGGTTSDMPQAQ